jgi:squalene synthase HpnC
MVKPHVAALLEPPCVSASLAEARALCLRLTRSHYENFTVLSRLVPRALREHVAALYAYCRTVDDIGDEAPGDRAPLLDRFETELDAAFNGHPSHPVLIALQATIRRFDLPREPFARLIEANRIDQRKRRMATYDELFHYCRHSANPVGRLYLMLHGYGDDERFALSDATCTALQLANFWQDLRRDRAAGRVYLPQDEMTTYGVAEAELDAEHASEPLRALMRFQVERTRALFAEGAHLIDRVSGRLRVDLALFSRGGLAILDAIERQDFDTLIRRPTLSGRAKLGIALSTLVSSRWRRTL